MRARTIRARARGKRRHHGPRCTTMSGGRAPCGRVSGQVRTALASSNWRNTTGSPPRSGWRRWARHRNRCSTSRGPAAYDTPSKRRAARGSHTDWLDGACVTCFSYPSPAKTTLTHNLPQHLPTLSSVSEHASVHAGTNTSRVANVRPPGRPRRTHHALCAILVRRPGQWGSTEGGASRHLVPAVRPPRVTDTTGTRPLRQAEGHGGQRRGT